METKPLTSSCKVFLENLHCSVQFLLKIHSLIWINQYKIQNQILIFPEFAGQVDCEQKLRRVYGVLLQYIICSDVQPVGLMMNDL